MPLLKTTSRQVFNKELTDSKFLATDVTVTLATLQAHDLCCRTRLTPLLTLRHSRQARQPQSTHRRFWLSHRLSRRSPLTLSWNMGRVNLVQIAIHSGSCKRNVAMSSSLCHVQRLLPSTALCSDGAFHSWPSFHCHQPLFASFCPSSPWMAFAGLGQFLAQWPRCPHFRETSLSVFPLAFALTSSCHLCPWNPFPFSCSCFASKTSRGDRIFRTFGTFCHRAVAVRRSPSVLCSSHWLHDASGNCCPCTRHIHKLLSKEGPRLESHRIQQQVRRELCVRHSVQKTIPTRKPSDIFSPEACSYNARSRSYASSFASMSPEKSNWSRLKSCPAVIDLMCGSYLSTNSCQARSPSVDLVFTTRSGPGPEVLCRSK